MDMLPKWSSFVYLSLLLTTTLAVYDWCPPPSNDEESCHLIAPTQWLFVIDMTRLAHPKSNELYYKVFTTMVTNMIHKLKGINAKYGKKRYHYGLFVRGANGIQVMKRLCDGGELGYAINWASPEDVIPKQPPPPPSPNPYLDAILEMQRQFDSCPPDSKMQRIVSVFANRQYLSKIPNVSDDVLLDNLKLKFNQSSNLTRLDINFIRSPVPVQVYLIRPGLFWLYERYAKEPYMHITNHTDDDYPFRDLVLILINGMPNAHINLLVNKWIYFQNCMCRQTENCAHVIDNITKCHFVQQNSNETCIMIQRKNITFWPKYSRHPKAEDCSEANKTFAVDCPLEDCIADCNLKKWGLWSPCKPAKGGPLSTRKRQFANASRSEYTQSCKEEESRPCIIPTSPTPFPTPEPTSRLRSAIHIGLVICAMVSLIVMVISVGTILILKRRKNQHTNVEQLQEETDRTKPKSSRRFSSGSASQSLSTAGGGNSKPSSKNVAPKKVLN